MSNKIKDVNIKNKANYYFNDIINIKNFDPNNIEIHGKSYKKVLFTTLDMWQSKIQNM